eukprot:scaffold22939_cov49-Attheya_sp.AAC.2
MSSCCTADLNSRCDLKTWDLEGKVVYKYKLKTRKGHRSDVGFEAQKSTCALISRTTYSHDKNYPQSTL